MLGVFVMSCCRKIDPDDPVFIRHCVPGKICPGVKITVQLLTVVMFTTVRSARKIENGNTNGLTAPNGLGSTMPKYLKCQSCHPTETETHESTINTRRRDFMGSLAERSERDTLKSPDSTSAPEASFIPLHTLVNAKLTLIDDHNFDRRAQLRN